MCFFGVILIKTNPLVLCLTVFIFSSYRFSVTSFCHSSCVNWPRCCYIVLCSKQMQLLEQATHICGCANTDIRLYNGHDEWNSRRLCMMYICIYLFCSCSMLKGKDEIRCDNECRKSLLHPFVAQIKALHFTLSVATAPSTLSSAVPQRGHGYCFCLRNTRIDQLD